MRKIFCIAALAVFCHSFVCQAALRGAASTSSTTTVSSISVTVSGIGIQSGDIVLCAVNGGGASGLATLTFPSGFSPISGLTQQKLSTNTAFAIESKTAGASEPSSYTFSSSATDYMTATCRVYSGRSGAITAETLTPSTTFGGSTSPQSLSISGLTAASADDVVLFVGIDNGRMNSGVTYTFALPTGFADGRTDYAASTTFTPPIGSADDVNTSSGTTGTLSSSWSWTGTGNNASQYAGFLISLAASGSSVHPNQMFLGM